VFHHRRLWLRRGGLRYEIMYELFLLCDGV
jgi:hypothetical protein